MNFTESQKEKALKLSSEYNEDETEDFSKKYTKEAWYHNFKLLFDMIAGKEYEVDKKTYLTIAGALPMWSFP